jgi:membrane protease YdiL (CAAX protease family)
MAAVVLSVWLVFKRPLSEIGFTLNPDIRSSAWAVIAFAILYAIDTLNSVATPEKIAASISEQEKRTPFMPTKMKELPAYVLMCVCAGVFEEIVYRGYIVTYFWHFFRGSGYQLILSVVLPAFVFSISHFYYGAKNIIKAFILSMFLGLIFIQSRSLVIVMFLHFLIDLIGGLLTIKYRRQEAGKD